MEATGFKNLEPLLLLFHFLSEVPILKLLLHIHTKQEYCAYQPGKTIQSPMGRHSADTLRGWGPGLPREATCAQARAGRQRGRLGLLPRTHRGAKQSRTALNHPPEASPEIKAVGKRAASWRSSRGSRSRSRNLPGTGAGKGAGPQVPGARVPGRQRGGARDTAGREAGGRRTHSAEKKRTRGCRRGRGAVIGPDSGRAALGDSEVGVGEVGRGTQHGRADAPWGAGVPRVGGTPRRLTPVRCDLPAGRERPVTQAWGAAAGAGWSETFGCVGAVAGCSRETGAPAAATPGISRASWASSGEGLGQHHLPRGGR